MAKKILGVDIGYNSIKLVQLQKNLNGYKILNLAYRELSFEDWGNNIGRNEHISQALADLIKENNLFSDQIISTVSARQAIIRNITLPFKDKKKIRQVMKFELEPEIALPIDNIVVDYHPIKTTEEKTEILTVGVDKKNIAEHIDIFSRAELETEIIDLDILSLWNTFITLSPPLPENNFLALIDLGADKTTVSILEDKQLKFVSVILRGGHHLTEHILRSFNLSHKEAEDLKKSLGEEDRKKIEEILISFYDDLLKDIRYAFNTYNSRYGNGELKNIYLTGGGAMSFGISEYFREKTGINISLFDPLKDISPSPLNSSQSDISPLFSAALGAALRGVIKWSHNTFNLRREEFALKKEGETKKYLVIYSVPLAILMAAGLFDFYYHLYLKEKRFDLLNQKVQTIFRETLPPNTKVVNEISQIKGKIKEGEKKLHIFGGIIGVKLSPLEIIHELSMKIPSDLKLDIREINISSEAIKFNGKTVSYDAVDNIKKYFETSPYFKEIKITAAKALTTGTGVEFSLEILIKG